MTAPILNVLQVNKRYATYRSNLARFANWFGASLEPEHEFWALRDISIQMYPGSAIALIGQNGAGKSTLLKIITGTTRPTTGTVAVSGRTCAILELGLGFNPEFTGRENVHHSGGLLGLSPQKMKCLVPEIEDFAEIGSHFDEPLRTYSSGMQARLAFALVTSVRPDVLIVDEVLSVGDSYFQHKSFARIREFKERGTSILLVSHSMGDVRELCDRVILLDEGEIKKDGLPDEVVDYYNAMIAAKERSNLSIEQRRSEDGWMLSRSGTFEAVVASMVLRDGTNGEELAVARVGQALVLVVETRINADIPRLVLGLMIRDRTGHVVWGTNTWHTQQIVENVSAGETITYSIAFTCDLGPGSYSISPALVSSSTHLDDNYEWTDNLLVFEVVNADKSTFIGTSYLDTRFTVTRNSS